MVRNDSYTPSGQKRYECSRCSHRLVTEEAADTCPECDGHLRNISVPRE